MSENHFRVGAYGAWDTLSRLKGIETHTRGAAKAGLTDLGIRFPV